MKRHVVSQVGSRWVVSAVEAVPMVGVSTTTLSTHATQTQALVAAAKLDGRRPPRLVPSDDFRAATLGSSSTLRVEDAARRVAVLGQAWQRVADESGVSTASISAFLHKHGLR